ncbi:ER protein big1 [Phlyctema vagabunda]|uniref:Protein BIG1 n=1 Tax=Phlyctema vagabunda TaxID=108571 RepID=A0ABR4P4H3_9HELO
MRFSIATTLVAGAATAHAFRDTSPFLLFSSSPLPSTISSLSTDQLQSAADVVKQTDKLLSSCSSDIYLVVEQPEISAFDVSSQTSIPFLRQALADSSVQTKYVISEVVGLEASHQARRFVDKIQKECGAELLVLQGSKTEGRALNVEGKTRVILSTFAGPNGDKNSRQRQLAGHDAELGRELLSHLKDHKYTVIYTTSPVLSAAEHTDIYDPIFQEALHMDLKRDVIGARRGNHTVDRRPLFEKYNYFSPGLFMGLSVTLLLLTILGVGVRALSSLEVSYGAFAKEMGPSAQK